MARCDIQHLGNVLEDPLEPTGRPSRSGIKTLASLYSRELRTRGQADLVGKPARSADDIAVVLQVTRDPRIEIGRWLYVKGGSIIDHEAVTSFHPATTAALEKGTIAHVRERTARLGADGVWFTHNHPLAEPTPSGMDRRVTAAIESAIPEFKGHVITDHEKYTLLERGAEHEGPALPNSRTISTATGDPDPLLVPRGVGSAADVLGREAFSPDVIAKIGAKLHNDPNYTVLVYTGNNSLITGVQEIPNTIFNDTARMAAYIADKKPAFGAAHVFAAGRHKEFDAAAQALFDTKQLNDAVRVNRFGLGETTPGPPPPPLRSEGFNVAAPEGPRNVYDSEVQAARALAARATTQSLRREADKLRALRPTLQEGRVAARQRARLDVLERELAARSQPSTQIPDDDPAMGFPTAESGTVRAGSLIPEGAQQKLKGPPPQTPLVDLGDGYEKLAEARRRQWDEGPNFIQRWLDDPHRMRDAFVTNWYNRFLPVQRMVENVEKVIGRKLRPHENPAMVLDLKFGGGMGPARVGIHELRELKVAAEKLGDLPEFTRILDIRGWERRLNMSVDALKKYESRAGEQVDALARSLSARAGRIGSLDKAVIEATDLGNLQLARRMQAQRTRAQKDYESLRRVFDRIKREQAVSGKPQQYDYPDTSEFMKKLIDKERKIAEGKLVPLGLTPEDIPRMKEQLARQLGPERWRALNHLADRVFEIQQRALKLYKHNGLIGEEAYVHLRSYGDDYVPLYRIQEVIDEQRIAAADSPSDLRAEIEQEVGGIGSLSIGRRKYLQRFVGSELHTIDPIDASAYAYQRAIQDVARNQATRSVIQMATMTPEVAKATGVVRLRRSTPINRQLRQLERLHGMKYDSISFFEDGVTQVYAVPKTIAVVMKYANPGDVDLMHAAMVATRQALRTGVVGQQLGFTVGNVPRDVKRMGTMMRALADTTVDLPLVGKVPDYLAAPGLRTARSFALWWEGVKHVIRKDDVWKAWNNAGGAFSTITSRANPATFLRLPGEEGLGSTAGIAGMQKALQRLLKLDPRAFPEAGGTVLTSIEHLNNIAEEATKVAAFRHTMDKLTRGDKSIFKRLAQGEELPPGEMDKVIEAALESRRFAGTPDAARKGLKGDQMNLLFMFWQVSLNGKFMDLARMLREPKKFLVPAIYAATLGNIIAAGYNLRLPRHDDGRLMWDHVPRDQRDNYHIVFNPFGEKDVNGVLPSWKIAKDHTFRRVWNPIEEAVMGFLGADTADMSQQALNAAADLAPLNIQPQRGNIVESVGHSAFSGLNPVPGHLFEQFYNRDFFTGSPIESETDKLSLPQNRFSSRTSPFAAAIGHQTGKVLPFMTPKRIESFFYGMFGGLGQEALRLGDLVVAPPIPGAWNLSPQERIDYNKLVQLPIIGAVSKALYNEGYRDGLVETMQDRFYSERAKLQRQMRDVRIDKLDMDPAMVRQKQTRLKKLEKASRELSELRKEIREAPDRSQTGRQHRRILQVLENLVDLTMPPGLGPTDVAGKPAQPPSTLPVLPSNIGT